jgi:hypothetical protein
LERSSFRVRWKPVSGGSIICAIIPQEALTASIAPNGRPPERITSGGGEGMAIEKSIVFASFNEACNEFYIIHEPAITAEYYHHHFHVLYKKHVWVFLV